jgi:hypothetical protein
MSHPLNCKKQAGTWDRLLALIKSLGAFVYAWVISDSASSVTVVILAEASIEGRFQL